MIRTNLSTRPFYNERAVHLALAAVALAAITFTAFNAWRIMSLSRQHTELAAVATGDEGRAADLRKEAAKIRQSIDRVELEEVAESAREANGIIDRRTFSWSELFNRLETTLPGDVRIVSIRPRIERDGVVVMTMGVMGRRVEDVAEFIENLEATGAFSEVLSRDERETDEGLVQSMLVGKYRPSRAVAAAGPPGPPGSSEKVAR